MQALRGADFVVARGELHALLGENGAGKSTLMAVAYGLRAPDEGTIERDGQAVRFASPLDARAAGIGMVHQHSTAIGALSVAENVALAAGWPVHRPAALAARVRALAEQVGLPLDPEAPVSSLGVALKQRLEIVKALASDATLLLLDEPAAVLAPPEAAELLRLVRAFCARGGSAVLITHKLPEALEHADAITVLRRGEVIVSGKASGFTLNALADAMIGEGRAGTGQTSESSPADAGSPVQVAMGGTGVERLVMEGVSVGPLRGASLTVRAGEIVGVAAVEGSGQRELLRTAAGLVSPSQGTATRPARAAFVPEDRTHEALIGDFTLTENAVLGARRLGGVAEWSLRGRVQWRAAREAVATLMTRFDVRGAGPEAAARSLSGGNQQKLVLGRALATAPELLVVEQPTRGLDFAATAFVHASLRQAAAEGAGVLLHAGDLDEVLALATRVVVMHDGVVREVPPGADRLVIGRMMLGQG